MKPLTIDDLMPLEVYARERAAFRARVMAHKAPRRVAVGPDATLYFEDRLTIQYQIQEMLRAERIFEPDEIAAELAAYNPLIPDGTNLKATFMLEYPDPTLRAQRLERLLGIERRVWIEVDGHARVGAIADEDLDRATEDKTSAVHFLRFELGSAACAAMRAGAATAVAIDHDDYRHRVALAPEVLAALAADFDERGESTSAEQHASA